MYQLLPASLALFCAFGLIGVILVCLTLRRLGFAEKAAAVLKTNVKKTVGTLCIVLASVTHCLVQMSIIAVYRFGMANEEKIKELVLLLSTSTIRAPFSVLPPTATYPLLLPSNPSLGSGIYQPPPATSILCFFAVLISVTTVCLALRRLDLAEKAATLFKTMVKKTVGALCVLVDQTRGFVTRCIVQLGIIHNSVGPCSMRATAYRNTLTLVAPLASRSGRNSPQTLLYCYRNSVPWDGRLPEDPRDINELWGCSQWKALKGLDLPWTFDYRRLEWLQDLGQGAYGEVARALTDTGLHITIKKINRGPWLPRRPRRGAAGKFCMIEPATILDNLLAEIQVPLAMAGYPNIIALHGVWHNAEISTSAWSSANGCMCLMTINAVKALHENGNVHLDIKPDNVLANGFELKLIDFKVEQPHTPIFWADNGTRQCLKGIAGTKRFISPLVENNKWYSYDADLYSVGVALFQWITKASGQLTVAQFVFFRKIFSVAPNYRFWDWDEVLRHRIWDELDQTKLTTTPQRTPVLMDFSLSLCEYIILLRDDLISAMLLTAIGSSLSFYGSNFVDSIKTPKCGINVPPKLHTGLSKMLQLH
ncbi:kinase-like domain-containing protein [Mycena amicta]|nr:kinase-like domain-containing protein [Mycena amicta]